MGKKPKLNVDKEEFIAMYKNHTQEEVALHFGMHFGICLSSMHKLRKRYGMPMKRQIFRTVDLNEFKRLYNEKVPMLKIAKKLNISKNYVYEIRNRIGLSYRNKAWEKKLDAENNT